MELSEEMLDTVEDILGYYPGEVEPMAYSGRFMYGEECIAFTGNLCSLCNFCEDLNFRFAAAELPDEREDWQDIRDSRKFDSMGNEAVMYFSSVHASDEFREMCERLADE